MATATPNFAEDEKDASTESYLSRLNTAIDVDDKLAESKRKNSHYFYSASNFHFILGKTFKPETLEMQELTKVPFMPSWHAGLVSIHGLIMPVIDVYDFLKTQNISIKESAQKKQYLLKLDHSEHPSIVFRLDSLPQLINTLELEEQSTTTKDSPEWIKHHLKSDSKIIAVIDHQKLFDQIIHQQ